VNQARVAMREVAGLSWCARMQWRKWLDFSSHSQPKTTLFRAEAMAPLGATQPALIHPPFVLLNLPFCSMQSGRTIEKLRENLEKKARTTAGKKEENPRKN